MITKQKKKEIVEELIDKLSRQKTVVFSDFTGLNMNQLNELRKKLKKESIDYKVAKKTLIDLALQKSGFKDIKIKNLTGQISAAFGYQDELAPAKILYGFSKKNNALKILAGLVNGEFFGDEQMIGLAKMPSKQELLAKLVGSLKTPLTGLSNALGGNLRKLIYIFKNRI